MIRSVYAIKDNLTEFKNTFIADNDAVAERSFMNLVKAGDMNEIAMAPQYYDLYLLGSYDTESGAIAPLKGGVKMIVSGSSVVEKKDAV